MIHTSQTLSQAVRFVLQIMTGVMKFILKKRYKGITSRSSKEEKWTQLKQ